MPEMQIDFDGLINLLARHLYSEKKVFIRELIQNAHDSIQCRKAEDNPEYSGRIDIDTRPADLRITVRDNGLGMSETDLKEYLSTVGASGTRGQREDVDGLIGQFGIGFLSAFVVADRVEVRTRKLGEAKGWLWTNSGSKEYQLTSCELDSVGTTVTVFIQGAEEKGVIHVEEVQDVIRRYADMLLVPIHLNDSRDPINTMRMPWEQEGKSLIDLQVDCQIYLIKTMKETVLETIPVSLSGDVNAAGVLYLTRTRVFNLEVPRNVRIFHNRMFLCENVPEILPKWASFVNGVINAPDLTPTAARDNFIRDPAAERLQEALGNEIIKHLEWLEHKHPDRFSKILRYHNWGIKSACYYYRDFFAKIAHLLEWRTNSGNPEASLRDFKPVWRTLPAILEQLPNPKDEPQSLSCFTDFNSANQYFQMADATKSIVVDASQWFEGDLLEDYTKLDGVNVQLVRIDRQEDPNVFRQIENDPDADRLLKLADVMSQFSHLGSSERIQVEARRFDPPELAAVIRSSERSHARLTAEEMLHDPNIEQDIREMADELVRMSRGATMKLIINASNPLIRNLARQDLGNKKIFPIIGGVVNNAILYNQELLTSANARILHDQYHELLETNLALLANKAALDEEREVIARDRTRLQSKQGPRPKHRIFFMMTPFDSCYESLIATLRQVVEDRWHCQLYVASDLQKEDRILDNVRAHIDQADAFITEISEANPNVMFELGAVRFDYHERPVLLLNRGSETEDKVELPADLGGLIYIDYGKQTDEDLGDFLEQEMRRHEGIQALLDDTAREQFLSGRQLKAITHLNLPETLFNRLSERYPTAEDWKNLTEDNLKPHMGEHADDAPALLMQMTRQRRLH